MYPSVLLFNEFRSSKPGPDPDLNLDSETNKELKEENRLLAERATNVSYVMSDLNTKLKDLENEKASLLTVIKILQSEQVHESNHGHPDWEPSRKCVSSMAAKKEKLQCKEENRWQHPSSKQTKIHCSSIIDPAGSSDNNKHDKRRKKSGQGQQPDEKIDNRSLNGNKRREIKFKNNREVQYNNKNLNIDTLKMGHQNTRQDPQSNHNRATVIIGDSIIKQIDCKSNIIRL